LTSMSLHNPTQTDPNLMSLHFDVSPQSFVICLIICIVALKRIHVKSAWGNFTPLFIDHTQILKCCFLSKLSLHFSSQIFCAFTIVNIYSVTLLSSITCATLLIATCLELACNEASLYVMYKYPLPKMQSQDIWDV